jgi:malonate-semialdehyde dehydrogenase (acetylating)/methylmalonate-semialdehyde dehydrogenase
MTQAAEGIFKPLKPLKEDYGVLKNYVDGEWVEATSDRYIDVEDPARGEVIAKVHASTTADVDRAVQAARVAFPDWRATPPIVRARYMFKFKEILEKHFEEIARITTQEHGKAIDEARGETRRAIENLETAAGIPTMMMGYNLEDGAAKNIDEMVIRQPLGVFAGINPFNFPGMVPFWFWPYAIATGNTFVIKVSKETPVTMTRIMELLEDADLPEGVLNMVHGDREVVSAILEHPDIKGVTFVGSTPVGRYIYERAGATQKRSIVQCGAKNFIVVMPDAEISRSVRNMMASFYGCTGQRCLAGANLVAVGDVYEPLKEAFLEASAHLKLGPGLDESVNMGPLVHAEAKERVLGYIETGINEGADLLLDGRDVSVPGFENGYFVGPTVFDGVTPDMTIAREEIFGPVTSILRAEDLEEAIALTNDSNFGNAASIYTTNGRSARTFRYKVEAGNIGVNLGIAAAMAYFPFGGMKDSFYGTLHGQGKEAVQFFTDSKVVIERW